MTAQRKRDLEDLSFFLEMASRNLMKAHERSQQLEMIGKDQIDRAVSNTDDVLMLVKHLLKRE